MRTPRGGSLAVAAMTAGCLFAFLVTIPLPRVDGQLVGSDGVKYYVYLPSILLDGDVDFSDEYAYFFTGQPQAAERLEATRTATGLPANRFGIGPALLWAPFFLGAHLLALALRTLGVPVAADGYGYLYQASVLVGSIVYGGLGAWFCLKAARRLATERAAVFATLLTVLAGNAVYYLTVEPSMSHALSMFAGSAFFLVWMRAREAPEWKGCWWLGALAGLMALIRPQDGLFLVLPIIDAAVACWSRRRHRAPAECVPPILKMVLAAVLVFVPQLIAWKLLNGDFLLSGYREEFGDLFRWTSPHLGAVLFSARRGLYVWHPVFLFSLVGLLWVARRDRRLAALAALGFVIQWYVVSAWHDWAQGDAFGGRMFIVCTPIFVIGAATLVDRAAARWSWRGIQAAGVVLVALNFLLVVQYRLDLLWAASPPTWRDLTLGRLWFLS